MTLLSHMFILCFLRLVCNANNAFFNTKIDMSCFFLLYKILKIGYKNNIFVEIVKYDSKNCVVLKNYEIFVLILKKKCKHEKFNFMFNVCVILILILILYIKYKST